MSKMVVIAPSWAMGATYVSGARSASMVMENGAVNQRNGQTIADAATTMACADILSKGAGGDSKAVFKSVPLIKPSDLVLSSS